MKTYLIASIAAAALLVGCAKQSEPEMETAIADISIPTSASPAKGATPIPVARKEFKPGDSVVLDGRIIGVDKPFVDGRAVFVLGDDDTITSCEEMPDDHCRRPWDACCDPVEIRAAGTATIQLVDADGKVLQHGLKGVGGLTELVRVTLTGTVAPGSTPAAFVVNADELYVHK